jgi:hypothetical protein
MRLMIYERKKENDSRQGHKGRKGPGGRPLGATGQSEDEDENEDEAGGQQGHQKLRWTSGGIKFNNF